MSRPLGAALPERLQRALASSADRATEAIVLLTVDEAGWAHPALLSYREVSSQGVDALRLETYAGSRTTANLQRDGHVTLAFVNSEMVFYVKGKVSSFVRQEERPFAVTTVEVVQVLEDAPSDSEEPAVITSGIRFRRV